MYAWKFDTHYLEYDIYQMSTIVINTQLAILHYFLFNFWHYIRDLLAVIPLQVLQHYLHKPYPSNILTKKYGAIKSDDLVGHATEVEREIR